MILKPDDLEAYCGNFTYELFKKAWEVFEHFVEEEICAELHKRNISMYFIREGKMWPFPDNNGNLRRSLTEPDLCIKFDEAYDPMRQMVDVEGNYYNHLLRNAIALAGNWDELLTLIPQGAHFALWKITASGPMSLSEDKILAFNQQNSIALNYLKKRLTFYSLGINKGFIQ